MHHTQSVERQSSGDGNSLYDDSSYKLFQKGMSKAREMRCYISENRINFVESFKIHSNTVSLILFYLGYNYYNEIELLSLYG